MKCIDCGDPSVGESSRCFECLEEVRETPDWRQAPRSNGRLEPRPDGVACPACARPLRPERRGKWCSESCRAWARYHPGEVRQLVRKCRRCDATLEALQRVWCSWECERPPVPRVKRICSEPGCGKPHRRNGYCKAHARKICPTPSDTAHVRKRNQLKNHVRRGRTRAPDAESIDRDVVGERDGWRCGICRRHVDRTKVYPHPRSPSLDHVIPQSQLGPHTYANVRISHLDCNVIRSNVGGGEQLALFG